MVIITDENDFVKEIALLPGAKLRLPKGWHCYFPITQEIPAIGQKFIPNLKTQPWLVLSVGSDKERQINQNGFDE